MKLADILDATEPTKAEMLLAVFELIIDMHNQLRTAEQNRKVSVEYALTIGPKFAPGPVIRARTNERALDMALNVINEKFDNLFEQYTGMPAESFPWENVEFNGPKEKTLRGFMLIIIELLLDKVVDQAAASPTIPSPSIAANPSTKMTCPISSFSYCKVK